MQNRGRDFVSQSLQTKRQMKTVWVVLDHLFRTIQNYNRTVQIFENPMKAHKNRLVSRYIMLDLYMTIYLLMKKVNLSIISSVLLLLESRDISHMSFPNKNSWKLLFTQSLVCFTVYPIFNGLLRI